MDYLPTEVMLLILRCLPNWETKQLSRVNKRLRAICIPFVFRSVRFEWSRSSLQGIKLLCASPIRNHVVSLTYVVPELLKPEVLEFDHFKSSILRPEDYVDEAKSLYDFGYPPNECPPYMMIYHSLRRVCQKQTQMVNSGIDLDALSYSFQRCPLLRKLAIYFCVTREREDWLQSYINLGMTMTERSYEHHIRTVSKALADARSRGRVIKTIHLSGFQLSNPSVRVSDVISLAGSLQELLSGIDTLQVTQSESALDLLSQCSLGIRHFDLCYLVVDYTSLRSFLAANHSSIQSIGFHDVYVSGMPVTQSARSRLNPDDLRAMLKIPSNTISRESPCHCLPLGYRGLRLFLKERYQ